MDETSVNLTYTPRHSSVLGSALIKTCPCTTVERDGGGRAHASGVEAVMELDRAVNMTSFTWYLQ
jgi:hypothetical protein